VSRLLRRRRLLRLRGLFFDAVLDVFLDFLDVVLLLLLLLLLSNIFI